VAVPDGDHTKAAADAEHPAAPDALADAAAAESDPSR
jgi:hypothetical protein